MTAYHVLSQQYDAWMDRVDYDAWADRLFLLIENKLGTKPSTLTDVACGTGAMSVRFAQKGCKVTGVDISPDMLNVAMSKARQAGVQVPFIEQDICNLTLHRPCQVITCICDGVNYLTDLTQVSHFFAAAHRNLLPHGVLAFDISSQYKIEEVLAGQCYGAQRADAAYVWENHYDGNQRLLEMKLSLFSRAKGMQYTRNDEVHLQRAHTIDEMVALLQKNGFAEIEIYGDDFAPIEGHTLRQHFIAKRME